MRKSNLRKIGTGEVWEAFCTYVELNQSKEDLKVLWSCFQAGCKVGAMVGGRMVLEQLSGTIEESAQDARGILLKDLIDGSETANE